MTEFELKTHKRPAVSRIAAASQAERMFEVLSAIYAKAEAAGIVTLDGETQCATVTLDHGDLTDIRNVLARAGR